MTIVVNRSWVLKLGSSTGDVRASVRIEGGIGTSVLAIAGRDVTVGNGVTVSLGNAASLEGQTAAINTLVRRTSPMTRFNVRYAIHGSDLHWAEDIGGEFDRDDGTARVVATIVFPRR